MEDKLLNIYLFGDAKVGKTSFIKALLGEIIPKKYSKTNETVTIKEEIQVEKEKYTLILYDIPGDKNIAKEEMQKIKDSDAIIFMYDATNIDSLKFILELMKYAKKTTELNCKKFVLGTKIDLEEKIKISNKDAFINSGRFFRIKTYFRISSIKMKGVYEVMSLIIKVLLGKGNYFNESILVRKKNINIINNQIVNYNCKVRCQRCCESCWCWHAVGCDLCCC